MKGRASVMDFKQILTNLFTWITEFAMSFGLKLLAALAVLLIGFKITKLIIKLIVKSKGFHRIDAGAQTFIKSFLNIVLKALVILTAASILGVPMTNFVAAIGSIGLAIGLAMQGSLSNVAGGLMILIFHPFRIGDFITANGVSGSVKEINILYTVLDTPDNVRIVVPNGELSNATVQNYSVNDTRRCDVDFGVGYGSDMKLVIKLLTDLVNSHELVLKDKDIFVKIGSFDESQITVKVRAWVNASDYWTLYFDLLEKGKELFDANGIEIPFPQLDVHLDK